MQEHAVVSRPGHSRREFIKTYVQFAAYFGLCAPVCRYFIGEVQAQSSGLTGLFNVNLSVSPFTALQQLNGSVRVEVPNGGNLTNGISELIATTDGVAKVIITRVATSGNSQFGTVSHRCTHQGQFVAAKTQASPNLVCSSGHGGQYNPGTGAVVQQPVGGGATALPAYLTIFNSAPAPGTLQIRIAGIGYSFVGSRVTSSQGPRMQLTFPSRSGTTYQVLFRDAAAGTDSSVPIFTTQNATSSVVSVAGTGQNITIWAAAQQAVGFYRINALP